ncbi:UNVERIFIED_CONTAM: putative pentatricopeptide repeat-containing protein, mitochondrial [Sesamum latifolium]|uniref:Pentatricopeptide repeat-containing protein, mitochondrial n=1 Tax=Sesamum latifolium TaxID=2727402 RepID=A0AAW2V0Q2_9LAMI
MSMRDVVSWSSIISTYVQNGQASDGLEMFRKMVIEGMEIDSVTMLSVAEACAELELWRVGKSSHGFVVRRNIGSDHEALGSSLVAMYGKFGDLCSAEKLFHNGVYQSVTSWTAMISSYNQNGCYLEALGTFIKMLGLKVESNSVTLMNVVCSCARLGWLREGKSIHGYIIRNNVDLDSDFLRPSLIDLYANSGHLRYSHRVFDAAQEKHIVSWNILISGYAREQMVEEALSLFVQMLIEGIMPDSFALASALSACGMIGLSELGCQIHCLIIKTYLPNEFVENALIDMYSKCGFINSATRVFLDTQQGSVITWNSMMCGFSQNGYSKEALSLFDEMYAKHLDMDEVTFLSAIQACSNLGSIDKGKWIHHKLITFGVRKDMYIDTALTNMYARCGDLQMAQRVFDNMTERTCSHAGYVEKGKFYFNSMVRDFGIMPNSEHYACLVDLLSRAGDLHGAFEVINSMPFPADASIWGALVNGCRIHQRLDFLNGIKRDLVNMDADDSGYYTLLSNVFAEGGNWNESKVVKSKMRSLALKKVHGYSMIETESNS